MKINKVLLLFVIGITVCYADKQNSDEESPALDAENGKSLFRNLVRPFRMEKLNLIWVKAQHVSFFCTHDKAFSLILVLFFFLPSATDRTKITIIVHTNENSR